MYTKYVYMYVEALRTEVHTQAEGKKKLRVCLSCVVYIYIYHILCMYVEGLRLRCTL